MSTHKCIKKYTDIETKHNSITTSIQTIKQKIQYKTNENLKVQQ